MPRERTVQLKVMVTPTEKREIKRISKVSSRTYSDMIRTALLDQKESLSPLTEDIRKDLDGLASQLGKDRQWVLRRILQLFFAEHAAAMRVNGVRKTEHAFAFIDTGTEGVRYAIWLEDVFIRQYKDERRDKIIMASAAGAGITPEERSFLNINGWSALCPETKAELDMRDATRTERLEAAIKGQEEDDESTNET